MLTTGDLEDRLRVVQESVRRGFDVDASVAEGIVRSRISEIDGIGCPGAGE